MEIIKYPKRQDCHYKLTAGSSNETSINLSSDILKLACPDGLGRGTSKKITFKLFRDDYIKALCYIVGRLPLYGRARGNNIVRYSYEFFQKELQKIINFFVDSYADYTVSILRKEDDRVYLKDLTYNGFNIRNFIVEDCTTMYFINSVDLQIRLKLGELKSIDNIFDSSDLTEEENLNKLEEPKETYNKSNQRLAVRDDVLKDFIYKVVYLVNQKYSLKLLEEFAIERKSGNIQLKNGTKYCLTAMFIATTFNDILMRNKLKGHVRWFETEFELLDKKVYLSNQWNGTGDRPLLYSSFISLINDAYPNKFIFSKDKDGMYELFEIIDDKK